MALVAHQKASARFQASRPNSGLEYSVDAVHIGNSSGGGAQSSVGAAQSSLGAAQSSLGAAQSSLVAGQPSFGAS